MNQVIDTIMKRRSVRMYEQREIPQDVLEQLIEAGNAAPTGANAQGWRFVVVRNDAFRAKLAGLALPQYEKWMAGAPEAFKAMRKEIDAVSSDPIYYSAPAILFVVGSGMTADFDSPMVCENVMLAARSLGIGSCWVYFGQFSLADAEVRATLGLKEGEKVYGPILLGYPKGGFPDAPPKKAAEVKWI